MRYEAASVVTDRPSDTHTHTVTYTPAHTYTHTHTHTYTHTHKQTTVILTHVPRVNHHK